MTITLSSKANARQTASEAASLATDYVIIMDAMIAAGDDLADVIAMLDESEADLEIAHMLVWSAEGGR